MSFFCNIETSDGASTIYFNKVNSLDSAWYQCTAQNQAGSTATRARLYVESKDFYAIQTFFYRCHCIFSLALPK